MGNTKFDQHHVIWTLTSRGAYLVTSQSNPLDLHAF